MACVTLKRSLDFDPLHSPNRPQKRRRCAPHVRPHVAPEQHQQPASMFRETPLTPEQIANNLRDEIKRLKRRRQFHGGPSSSPPGSPSRHDPPSSPRSAPSSPEPMMDMDTMAMAGSSSAMRARAAAAGDKDSEKPIFTLKQMIMIADRMCEERVEQVRAEYDNILQQKLSEQVIITLDFFGTRDG